MIKYQYCLKLSTTKYEQMTCYVRARNTTTYSDCKNVKIILSSKYSLSFTQWRLGVPSVPSCFRDTGEDADNSADSTFSVTGSYLFDAL